VSLVSPGSSGDTQPLWLLHISQVGHHSLSGAPFGAVRIYQLPVDVGDPIHDFATLTQKHSCIMRQATTEATNGDRRLHHQLRAAPRTECLLPCAFAV
jgi:hypothetical protein